MVAGAGRRRGLGFRIWMEMDNGGESDCELRWGVAEGDVCVFGGGVGGDNEFRACPCV